MKVKAKEKMKVKVNEKAKEMEMAMNLMVNLAWDPIKLLQKLRSGIHVSKPLRQVVMSYVHYSTNFQSTHVL